MPARQKLFLSAFIIFWLLFSSLKVTHGAIEFAIDNVQTISDEIEANVLLTGLSGSSCNEGLCYLQATLTAENQTQYFGFTQNHQGNWYEYVSSPSIDTIKNNFFAFSPHEGSWSGKLKAKNNGEDSNYEGPGTYVFKLRRYSGKSSSHAGESNAVSVQLSFVPPTPTPSPPPTGGPTPTPTNTPTSIPTAKPTSTPTPTSTQTAISESESGIEEEIGMVAGTYREETKNSQATTSDQLVASSSASRSALSLVEEKSEIEESENQKKINFALIGLVMVVGSVVSFFLKRYNISLVWPFKK